MAAASFRQRDLSKRMTMTVTIRNPTHHRALYWLGMKGLSLSCRLLGIGRLNVEVDR